MAFHLCAAFTKLSFGRNHVARQRNGNVVGRYNCMAGSSNSNQITVRRTAHYKPTIWDYDFVQSLKSEYEGEKFTERVKELKEEVKMMMLNKNMVPLEKLELIDTLQRLGIAYHFSDEIKTVLKSIYNHTVNNWMKEDLYAAALQFRLFRQHGFKLSQDELGNFKKCHCEDFKGLLSLYEASYVLEEGENVLEVARKFTTISLQKHTQLNKNHYLSILISQSLEVPLHWRMLRFESRWFIDVYEQKQDMNPLLLQFAKLNFNIVQAMHLDDLKYTARWWRNTGLGEHLKFARDRIVENFLWTVGVIFEPQFGYFRRMATKVNALITTIDDIYDVYGTLDELQQFTDAVQRWDVNAMEQLPYYMKLCFLTLHNSINQIAYDPLKEQGIYSIPYLKKAWADICKCYLLEAKWHYNGYTPSFEEYMDNAWISISAPVILVHAFFLLKNPITNDALKCLNEYPRIIRYSSTILRLADDLGTSSDEVKRGDVPKSIQCYMHETGVSEEKAREHIRSLICETWKKMNKERVADDSPFSDTFIGVVVNLARMALYMYQYGDGHGNNEEGKTKDRVMSLLIHPIPIQI
ncbi:terpene synthase 10-like isoform X2 [Mercurialis annua]|uniref:terpene synthase 10-like isoform X2 n=1 Tax=Mercurialis annua TaxID=3986 RepID=UPI00215FDA48|nr:terpene synthase 10-like isoform X2 [Mercurialis annua]